LETFEINWTSRAVKDLKKIYHFYTEQIGEEKSFRLVNSLVDKVDVLSDGRFSKVGAVDDEFTHLKRQYKKLIFKNIKITYRLSSSKSVIYIIRVFDTRQNPLKNR